MLFSNYWKARMYRRVAIATLVPLLASCGGESEVSPLPATPTAGRYLVSNSVLAPSENGELLVLPTGQAFYSVHRRFVGSGAWAFSGGSYVSTINVQPILVDGLGNEFPIAKGTVSARNWTVTSSGAGYTGPGLVLSRSDNAAPRFDQIPRRWQFSNLFNFGGLLVSYTLNIDISTSGTISGADSNGCVFSGALSMTATNLYGVRIAASACGATDMFMENYEYSGAAYVAPGGAANSSTLHIIATNPARPLGLRMAVQSLP